jgi:FlaG/FlaF family flagellin (archaellin)
LKEIGSIDHTDYLSNLTLSVNGDVISSVDSMVGKYVTFSFDEYVLEDGKNESFTVKADIIGGAGDEVQFDLDNVVDIEATASKYNAVNVEMDGDLTTASGEFGSVSVEAGELTIYAIDAIKDEVRSDKDDVVLGQLRIVNVAGKNLELDNVKVLLELAGATTATVDELDEVLENVEIEINGTSYDLNKAAGATSAYYSETDLDIILEQGTTIVTVR